MTNKGQTRPLIGAGARRGLDGKCHTETAVHDPQTGLDTKPYCQSYSNATAEDRSQPREDAGSSTSTIALQVVRGNNKGICSQMRQ
jgi:hypothetical protein